MSCIRQGRDTSVDEAHAAVGEHQDVGDVAITVAGDGVETGGFDTGLVIVTASGSDGVSLTATRVVHVGPAAIVPAVATPARRLSAWRAVRPLRVRRASSDIRRGRTPRRPALSSSIYWTSNVATPTLPEIRSTAVTV